MRTIDIFKQNEAVTLKVDGETVMTVYPAKLQKHSQVLNIVIMLLEEALITLRAKEEDC